MASAAVCMSLVRSTYFPNNSKPSSSVRPTNKHKTYTGDEKPEWPRRTNKSRKKIKIYTVNILDHHITWDNNDEDDDDGDDDDGGVDDGGVDDGGGDDADDAGGDDKQNMKKCHNSFGSS